MGEGSMGFPTYLGTVHLEASEEAMTPFGGLVPRSAQAGG